MSEKIKVIPCSGMGKVYGLVGRESALKVVKELCPKQAETMCLAYIVTGDEEVKEQIRGKKCITIDGCPAMCSAKSVELAGGDIIEKRKVLDTFRHHRGVKAGSATKLTEEGWNIVDEIAEDIANTVRTFGEEE